METAVPTGEQEHLEAMKFLNVGCISNNPIDIVKHDQNHLCFDFIDSTILIFYDFNNIKIL